MAAFAIYACILVSWVQRLNHDTWGLCVGCIENENSEKMKPDQFWRLNIKWRMGIRKR